MRFCQNEFTGCVVIGAITSLGHDGPKHYGIVIGESDEDGKVYIAEQNVNGKRLISWDDFTNQYKANGDIKIYTNRDKNFTLLQVAQRALNAVTKKVNESYDLLTNNCEHFVNEMRFNKKESGQVVTTVLGILVVIGIGWLVWQAAKQTK
jgi:hypothetical protein